MSMSELIFELVKIDLAKLLLACQGEIGLVQMVDPQVPILTPTGKTLSIWGVGDAVNRTKVALYGAQFLLKDHIIDAGLKATSLHT